jgi:hypothetical protein
MRSFLRRSGGSLRSDFPILCDIHIPFQFPLGTLLHPAVGVRGNLRPNSSRSACRVFGLESRPRDFPYYSPLDNHVRIGRAFLTLWRVKMMNHITGQDLERYYSGMVVDEGEPTTLEEHLLMCWSCMERAEQTAHCVDNRLVYIQDDGCSEFDRIRVVLYATLPLPIPTNGTASSRRNPSR